MTRPPLPTEPDADPQVEASLCSCGIVWLPAWSMAFCAEGAEHTRNWCARLNASAS